MLRAHVDAEALAEQLGARLEELRFFADDVADVIGQAAVGEGDKGPALEHDDLGLLIQPAQTRGTGGASSDAANYDDFSHDSPQGRMLLPAWRAQAG